MEAFHSRWILTYSDTYSTNERRISKTSLFIEGIPSKHRCKRLNRPHLIIYFMCITLLQVFRVIPSLRNKLNSLRTHPAGMCRSI